MSNEKSHEGVPASPEMMEQFREWLQDSPLDVSVVWRCEHGQWYCLIEDYDITGMGASERDAYRDAINLASLYLFACFSEGMPVVDAKRPIPMRLKLEIRRDLILGGITKRLLDRPSPAHESRVVMLPEQVAAGDLAVC